MTAPATHFTAEEHADPHTAAPDLTAALTHTSAPSRPAPHNSAAAPAVAAPAPAPTPRIQAVADMVPAPLEQPAFIEVREPTSPSSPSAAPAKLPAPSASQVEDTASEGPSSRGSDDGHSDSAKSGRSTQDAAQEVPRLTHLKEHVQQAFSRFKRTVGASPAEIKKAGKDKMDARIRAALDKMSIAPTAENYVLAMKARRLIEKEAKKGLVADDMVYWYMAQMYAYEPTKMACLANPTPEDCDAVRAQILQRYGRIL